MVILVPPLEAGVRYSALRSALPDCVPKEAVRSTPILEIDEPIEAVDPYVASRPVYSEPQFSFREASPEVLLRRTVILRLVAASRSLPEGFDILVLDGWRSAAFQAELVRYYGGAHEGLTSDYVADPDDATLVAPHTTGGAVDLTLAYEGVPLALGTEFDDFSPMAHLDSLEGHAEWDMPALLRRMLAGALVNQGFCPYPWEWWHWSFGDQRWAAQYGESAALYGMKQAAGGVTCRTNPL